MKEFTAVEKNSRNQANIYKGWREPALKLLMQVVETGKCQVSKEVIEKILFDLDKGYGKDSDDRECIYFQRLPQQIKSVISCLLEVVEVIRQEPPDRRPRLCSPEDIFLLFNNMIYLEQELLKVVFLDSDYRFLSFYDAALGKSNHVWVEPRLIFRTALEREAQKIVVLHNHPSGELCPSEKDILFTRKISRGCKLFGIQLLDHLILSNNEKKMFSFAENNLL